MKDNLEKINKEVNNLMKNLSAENQEKLIAEINDIVFNINDCDNNNVEKIINKYKNIYN